jgi:hypothetical protein
VFLQFVPTHGLFGLRELAKHLASAVEPTVHGEPNTLAALRRSLEEIVLGATGSNAVARFDQNPGRTRHAAPWLALA